MTKIFVSGGCGYVGSVLVRTLAECKHFDITVMDNLLYRQTSPLSWYDLPNVKFVYGDVRNRMLLSKHAKDADVIIPLAAIVGMSACDADPQMASDVNEGHVEYLASTKSPNQIICYPNSNSGYGVGTDGVCTEETPLKPISHYGRTKCAAEDAVLAAGGTSLRLATVFGISPRMRLDLLVNDFTYRACKDKFLVLYEAHFNRNYVHVKDVAEAFTFILNKYDSLADKLKGQAFNLGLSSANLSKLQLAQKIQEYVPDLNIMCAEVGTDPDQRNYIVSNDKIESLGFRPRYTLDEGIKELIKYNKVFRRVDSAGFTNL